MAVILLPTRTLKEIEKISIQDALDNCPSETLRNEVVQRWLGGPMLEENAKKLMSKAHRAGNRVAHP